jgi:hypothetical protein
MLCYKKKKESYTEPLTEQQFYRLLRSKQWNRNIDLYRETGKDSYKTSLPAICFQATFDKSKRAIKDKKTKKVIGYEEGCWNLQKYANLTGLAVLDIDHVGNPLAVFERWKTLDFEKLGILFVFITPSGKGLKIVFKANIDWGNLADNQLEMAKLLGVEADESGKDASRIAFICKEEDVLFIDKQLFTYENKEFAEKYNDQYRNGNSNPTHPAAVAHQEDRPMPAEGREVAAEPVAQQLEELTYHDVPYNAIIQAWLGEEKIKQGDRHRTSLLLADHLRYITDNDPVLIETLLRQTPFVKEIVEERNENVAGTVHSAMNYDMLKGLPKRLQAALFKVGITDNNGHFLEQRGQSNASIGYAESRQNWSEAQRPTVNSENESIDYKLWLWGEQIEQLSESFPLLKDVCKGLKRNQFTAALFVAGSLMMTLMTRCTYRFYHRPEELRRLNSSVIIEGDPACGKSFATRLYKLLMAPIFASDKIGKEAINAYRELMKTKGANKEKPKKPKAVVRIHPARTSNAQFIQDMVNAVEEVDGEEMQLHMLTFDTELDNTLSLQKGGSWIDKISLELKAFHNEEDGQAYSNVDSVMQDFVVTWNYIYTGTPLALKKKVNERNFGTGLATRLTCIPLPSTNFEMLSRESNVDYESDDRLKEWAFKLDKTKGELSVQKIVDGLYGWTERRMADAKENESKADEMLLKRCAYHGLNFAAPYIIMRHWNELRQDGEFWCGEFQTDDTDWQLAELIVNIQYACQKHYFGAMAEMYFDNKLKEASVNRQRQQKTIEAFNRLPDEFTSEDVVHCFNLKSESSAQVKILRLKSDGLIEKLTDYVENGHNKSKYCKTGRIII